MYITPVNGQSNYDLCLKGYGSLDGLVKMCKDNEITDINIVEKKPYFFDESYVKNINFVGYNYATNLV